MLGSDIRGQKYVVIKNRYIISSNILQINIKEVTSKRIISCGVLETPRFGRKTNFFFVPGTKVTFECNQNFVLTGDQRRTCLPEGRWDVPEHGYTECLSKLFMSIILISDFIVKTYF